MENIFAEKDRFSLKRIVLVILLLVALAPRAHACVGKMLTIGVLNFPKEQVLAEMLSAMINERTGTSVRVRSFASLQELYAAVKAEQVDISIENTARALSALNRPREADPIKALEVVKTVYEREKGLIWLKPFGFLNGGEEGPSFTAAILRTTIVDNFPALPRVIGKLVATINDEVYRRLIRSLEAGENPKKVARDFLVLKKLI